MKGKVFYTLIHKRNFSGIKQVEGYEFAINGNKFYGYANKESNKVYIIDPETGTSIYDYPIFDDECQEINAMKYTIDRLMEDEYILEAFEKKRDTEKYGLMQETFQSYLHASELEEKLNTNKRPNIFKL